MDGHCEVDFDGATDDCEPVQAHRTNFPIARREHRCRECRAPIAVGEKYRRDSYDLEGRRCVDRTCAACYEVIGEFEFHILGGFLWEYFSEEWGNGARLQGCLNRLTTVRAKERMRAEWAKWRERADR